MDFKKKTSCRLYSVFILFNILGLISFQASCQSESNMFKVFSKQEFWTMNMSTKGINPNSSHSLIEKLIKVTTKILSASYMF